MLALMCSRNNCTVFLLYPPHSVVLWQWRIADFHPVDSEVANEAEVGTKTLESGS